MIFLKYKDKRNLTTIKDLRHLVLSAADRFGDKTLYASPNKKHDFRYSYNDLKENVLNLATAFLDYGFDGEKIAVIGEAHPAYMTTYYATVISGNVIVPLDKELEENQIVNFINRAECIAVVYMPSMNGVITSHADELETVKYFIAIEEDDIKPEGYVPYSDVIAKGKNLFDGGKKDILTVPQKMDEMSALLFTSGTTGTSKGVMLSQRNIATAANASCETVIYDETCTMLSVLPMNHSYEVTCAHIALTNLGCTDYLNDSLKYTLKNLKTVKPDSLVLVPLFLETMYKAVWKEIDKKGMRKKVEFGMKLSNALRKVGIDIRRKIFKEILDAFGGRLSQITCGGAPLSPKIVKDFETFGIMIHEGYGITECSPLLAVNRPYAVKYGSVGPAVPQSVVRIDNPDETGTGEIVAKGDNIMLGYYKDEESTKEAFTEDGWFKTGDLGHIDGDGYIYITGRKKNLIILSNGKNVYPEEIEEHLYESKYICECVVIARKSAEAGELITAIIYPNMELFENKSDEEIYKTVKDDVDRINTALPSFKQIHQVEIRKTEFEKTTTKKIKRFIIK